MNIVFVTGGTGFLGSKIVESFLNEGYHVIILVRKNSSFKRIKKILNHPRLSQIFLSKDSLNECFSAHKINAIIHTATCYGRNNESWSEVADVNLLLPLQLLILGEQHGVECFINADTFFNDKMVFLRNEGYYVKTKKTFLAILKDASVQMKIKSFNLKIEQMYGPNDSSEKFVPSVIKNLLVSIKNIPLTKGYQKRDFIFVEDVASAFLKVFKNRMKLKKYEEFSIGSGVSIRIKEAVTYLKKIIGSKSILEFGKLSYRKNEIMDSKAILSNNKKINWQSSNDWHDGFKKTVDFYRDLK